MNVKYGEGKTQYGPGVEINLTGAEVAIAIDAYLVAHRIIVDGPRTITVNGELCEVGLVYVDPSGRVIHNGEEYNGRGPSVKDAVEEAVSMMRIPMIDLPTLALEFAKYVSNKIGFCGETCITAYAIYNQVVHKMKCDDPAYKLTDPEWINWWEEKGFKIKE